MTSSLMGRKGHRSPARASDPAPAAAPRCSSSCTAGEVKRLRREYWLKERRSTGHSSKRGSVAHGVPLVYRAMAVSQPILTVTGQADLWPRYSIGARPPQNLLPVWRLLLTTIRRRSSSSAHAPSNYVASWSRTATRALAAIEPGPPHTSKSFCKASGERLGS
jgi:hypothetical protein